MCSIKWRCFWRPLVTLNPQTTQIFAFFVASHIFAVRQVGILILIHRLAIASPSIRTTKCPWKGRGYVTWPILNLEGTIILLMHDAMRYMPSSCVCLSVCLTHNGDFAIILHKIGCHGNVPWDIERGPDRSSTAKKLSFDVKIAKIGSADLEIICLWEIIKKDQKRKKCVAKPSV